MRYPRYLRRGGELSLFAGAFLFGFNAQANLLGTGMMAAGALAYSLDWHHIQQGEQTAREFAHIEEGIGARLDEVLEVVTSQHESLHEDIQRLGQRLNDAQGAAAEFGRQIGQESQRRRNHEDRQLLDTMENDMGTPDGKHDEQGGERS